MYCAAYKHVLNPLYLEAMHVSCPSHGLNGVGKAMIAELPTVITTIFEKAPGLLHPKRHASRRRRWFAALRRTGLACSVPVKYIDTRWVVWRTCVEWWVVYYDAFLDFLISEKGRYAADKVPQNIHEMIERMQKSPRALVASMVFMIEETNLLASVLNLSRGGGCCCCIR